jgi:multiple sugar transport system permease protein
MATPFSTTVASLVGGASAVTTLGLADIAVQDVPKWCREASMSNTQHALGFGRSLPLDEWRRPAGRIRLQGSDTVWAIAFLVPYVGVFVAFVAYPVVFGLWMGHDPALYGLLMSDPRFVDTAINTLVFVAIGVNVTMFGALLLSGFFMRRTWWRRLLLAVFLIPWALPGFVVFTSIHFMLVSQWGLLNSLIRAVTGEDGPLFLVSTPIAMASNIVAYIWKWLPFWTLIFVAGRMAIPQDIYEAADIDGATGHKRLIYVNFPLLASVYLICTLLDTVWTLGDYPTVYFVSSGAPARTTDVLATYGVHEAFDFARPYLGVAAMMSALPILIPVVLLLMRRVRAAGVQL